METIRVDILNPKAKKLLKNLMDLKLIRISEEKDKTKQQFFDLLKELRTDDAPSLEEIQSEVKAVRKEMGKNK